jgi:hypothetical protein
MSLACSMLVAIFSLSLLLIAEVAFLIWFQIREEHRQGCCASVADRSGVALCR